MLATGNFGFTKSACKSVLPLYLDMEAEGCYEIHENCGLPKKDKNVNTVVSSFGSCEFWVMPLRVCVCVVSSVYSDEVLFCEIDADSD